MIVLEVISRRLGDGKVVNGQVTISLSDFDRLRDSARKHEEFADRIKECMQVIFVDKEEQNVLFINKDKAGQILKQYNPEDELTSEDIGRVEWI